MPTTGWRRASSRTTIARCTANRRCWLTLRVLRRGPESWSPAGFKPKDAAQITLQEITFENRNDPNAARKAQADAEDFLRRVKDGLI